MQKALTVLLLHQPFVFNLFIGPSLRTTSCGMSSQISLRLHCSASQVSRSTFGQQESRSTLRCTYQQVSFSASTAPKARCFMACGVPASSRRSLRWPSSRNLSRLTRVTERRLQRQRSFWSLCSWRRSYEFSLTHNRIMTVIRLTIIIC